MLVERDEALVERGGLLVERDEALVERGGMLIKGMRRWGKEAGCW